MAEEINWKQNEIIHCPVSNCKGMLLHNEFSYVYKCSDCGNFYISKLEWIEVKGCELK